MRSGVRSVELLGLLEMMHDKWGVVYDVIVVE